ncbi:MAG: NAD-dependent epimerase/dehydratase family protein [Desulfosudaceae bacterium]
MKVLITGAAGFMGTALCRRLAETGNTVTALIFPGEPVDHIRDCVSKTVEGDITRPETLQGVGDNIDVVYHLAARVLDYGTRRQFYGSIVDGTRNMLNACADRAGRFVYVSSICACGTGRHMKGMKESDPCVKTGVYYGDAKMAAEELVRTYDGRFAGGWAIIRPANVTGPGSVWVREVAERFQTGIVALFDQGRYSASLIYIDNLTDGLVLAGKKEAAAGQTYFMRDDWQVTWKRYLTDLAAMLDKRPWFSLPFRPAWLMGAVSETVSRPFNIRPMVTRHAVGLMGRDNDVDTSKAVRELGWKTRVSYDEAMNEIGRWVKENMK